MSGLFADNKSGAKFSECRKYRYALWRIWDESNPLVMFIGLNPSTANESVNDPTIKSVCRIAKNNGYGGVYMMNCFAYISTNPDDLIINTDNEINDNYLIHAAYICNDNIVFAWGNFDIVKETGRGKELSEMFPNAKVLHLNKNGSPKHPLYCKSETELIKYKSQPTNE